MSRAPKKEESTANQEKSMRKSMPVFSISGPTCSQIEPGTMSMEEIQKEMSSIQSWLKRDDEAVQERAWEAREQEIEEQTMQMALDHVSAWDRSGGNVTSHYQRCAPTAGQRELSDRHSYSVSNARKPASSVTIFPNTIKREKQDRLQLLMRAYNVRSSQEQKGDNSSNLPVEEEKAHFSK